MNDAADEQHARQILRDDQLAFPLNMMGQHVQQADGFAFVRLLRGDEDIIHSATVKLGRVKVLLDIIKMPIVSDRQLAYLCGEQATPKTKKGKSRPYWMQRKK